MSELFQFPQQQPPQDPREFLSEAARKRLDRVLEIGDKARRAAELAAARNSEDEAIQIEFDAARFDFAFVYLSAVLAEFKAGGFRGERLREIMTEEIMGAANSLELHPIESTEKFFRDIFFSEWGW